MIRVLVADDQEIAREGLRQMLSSDPDFEVIATAADGTQAIDLAKRHEPDVCILDIRMPNGTGLDVIRELNRHPNPPAVVFVTTFDLDEYVYEALCEGARGFVLKSADASDILAAAKSAAHGESLVSPTITRRLINHYVQHPPAPPERHSTISEREHEVLLAVANGNTNAEIANGLDIAVSTVKGHIANLMTKTGATNRVQLVIWAYRHTNIRTII